MAYAIRASAQLLLLSCIFGVCSRGDVSLAVSPHDRAWAVLRDGLREEKGSRRAEAVRALSLISRERRASLYALRALNDKDASVRVAAACTLGQLRSRRAIPALREALSDKEIAVVLAAAYSLYTLHDSYAYSIYYAILMGDKKAKEGMVQAQLDRLKDPKQLATMGIQQGLGFVPFGGIGYEAFRAASKKDAVPVRAAAARFLAQDPDPVSRDALVQIALADNSEIVRQAALDALAERGDPRCVEMLQKNLEDEHEAVRYRTAAAIIHLESLARTNRKSK